MRTVSLVIVISLGLAVGTAHAQTDAPVWDVTGSVGLLEARFHRHGGHPVGSDVWSAERRYAVGLGHYWTEHLKTEVELTTSGESSTYGFIHPSSVEVLNRLDQVSVRTVWQFGENRWVHPYISGGVVGDRARARIRIPTQYQYPSGRTSGPMILTPESVSEPSWDRQIGFTIGAGAKLYMSPNAFFNAGVINTYSKAAATVSLVAGLGIDF